jgi:hypothetical protein
VFKVAGVTSKRRKWFGVEIRPGSESRAERRIRVSREAGRASCFLGAKAGFGPHRRTKVPGQVVRFPPVAAKKNRKQSGVSDAEPKAKAREMGRGSLSISIVACESGVTHPKEPASSQGGCRDYGPVA